MLLIVRKTQLAMRIARLRKRRRDLLQILDRPIQIAFVPLHQRQVVQRPRIVRSHAQRLLQIRPRDWSYCSHWKFASAMLVYASA